MDTPGRQMLNFSILQVDGQGRTWTRVGSSPFQKYHQLLSVTPCGKQPTIKQPRATYKIAFFLFAAREVWTMGFGRVNGLRNKHGRLAAVVQNQTNKPVSVQHHAILVEMGGCLFVLFMYYLTALAEILEYAWQHVLLLWRKYQLGFGTYAAGRAYCTNNYNTLRMPSTRHFNVGIVSAPKTITSNPPKPSSSVRQRV